ncbi:PalH/RIM21-domain-containing protein [Xylariaceae sp. FL0594]|nr:PalH/RIM21-domain-containing protein [Xylariaceae sp. FL0594]
MATACVPLTLPANGVLSVAGATPTTLTADAVFIPSCATAAAAIAHRAIIVTGSIRPDEKNWPGPPDSPNKLKGPFYSSISAQCYALAATTVLAYTLLIMLVIAPRSFLDGGVVTLGRRGFTNGASGGISIGGRPWLQKVATLLVAVSLTIATVETFREAEDQYHGGKDDAQRLQQMVQSRMDLKVIQLISDTFLWLAQAQTLIRLFPRQREKIIIKWTAFALISLDVIFGALNTFRYMAGSSNSKPSHFTEPVPALSYLFQLSLSLLYAAWVLYYALMKKRYAFYHPLMRNICLVAVLSIGALLVPVVFFVLDVVETEINGWGDYVRWVGAAAASVVVWEWVERIEALEREEKKDGVLGREVFDGDEMIEISPSDLTWPRKRKIRRYNGDKDGQDGGVGLASGNRLNVWPAMSPIARRYRSRPESNTDAGSQPQLDSAVQAPATGKAEARLLQPPLWPSRPPPAATPVSRTDTASADSTIYRVRYQPLTETASRTTEERYRPSSQGDTVSSSHEEAGMGRPEMAATIPETQAAPKKELNKGWGTLMLLNPFHRRCRDPPAEVLPHTSLKPITSHREQREHEKFSRWDIKSRIEDFAATQAERVLQRLRTTPDTDSLPITVIPAQPRRGAALAQLLEDEEFATKSPPRPPLGPPARVSSPPPPLPGRPRGHSGGSQPVVPPMVGPSDLSDTSLSGPVARQGSGPGSEDAGSGQRHTGYSQRRPVDDLIQDPVRPQGRHPT